jgi:hypothetical protein
MEKRNMTKTPSRPFELPEPLKSIVENAIGWELEARYWYRQLLGADAPHLLPQPADDQAEERDLLSQIYPNDPQEVEQALAKGRGSAAAWANEQCWGPNWIYLREALATHCGITPAQAMRMTWDEIAIALRPAVEKRAEVEKKRPPTIWSHSGQSYSVDGFTPIGVSNEIHQVLKLFLDRNEAISTKSLGTAVNNVSAVVTKIENKLGSGAVRRPKEKGDGYFIRVRTATTPK